MKYTLKYLVLLTLLAFTASSNASDVEAIFFKGHANGRVTGFESTDTAFFKAQPLGSRYYTEIWFNEMQFPAENIIVIVGFQLHNLGISRRYLDTFITVSDPATGMRHDTNHYDPGKVWISDEGFSMGAESDSLELTGGVYRIRFDGKVIKGDFTYKILAPSFQQGDGRVFFPGSGDFIRHNFPIPWAKVSGHVSISGKTIELKGNASMNHDWQDLSPTRYMGEWRAFWLYSDQSTVSAVLNTSADLAPRWVKRLMVAETGKILFSSQDYSYREENFGPVPGSPIPLPRRFVIEASHGRDSLKGTVTVTGLQEQKEVLAEYPAVFRWTARLFVKETWSYRFWTDFDFELNLAGKTREIKGRGTANYVSSVRVEPKK
jgi:hypothetical protein